MDDHAKKEPGEVVAPLDIGVQYERFMDIVTLRDSITRTERLLNHMQRDTGETDDPEHLAIKDISAAYHVKKRGEMIERYMRWVEEYANDYHLAFPVVKDEDKVWEADEVEGD